jgi:hypothetical protein
MRFLLEERLPEPLQLSPFCLFLSSARLDCLVVAEGNGYANAEVDEGVGVGCTSLGAVIDPGHMLSSSSVICQAPPWTVAYAANPCFSLVAAAAA